MVELYVALAQNKPAKGDKKAWDEKTQALVTAAKAVAKGDKDAVKKLMDANNCQTCHEAHSDRKIPLPP